MLSHRLEHPQCTHSGDIGGVDRQVERDPHVALGTQVVDLVGRHVIEDRRDPRGIGQVAIVQLAARVTQFAPPVGDQPMDVVVAFEQEFGQVRPILP